MSVCKRKTSIGGQALIEGIMMRGPQLTAMAVRLPSGEIDVESWPTYPEGKRPFYKTMPFLRGIFNMVETFSLGFRCLMKSAEKAGVEEEEPSKFELWLSDHLGANLNTVVSTVAILLGVALAVGLFIVIPTFLASFLTPWISSTTVLTLIEGAIKIVIFIFYLYICSRNKDVARVFEYHGAEHKTIACYEDLAELTPENCRRYTRFHPRCGTSFLLIVLVISILVTSLVGIYNPLLRMLVKLLLLPVVVGISYEIIKLAGRYDNICTRVISAPGLWLQRLTTKEPDASELEVAIAAMKVVIPENEGDDKW
ncbi:DUF1385 domain-containing protein [Angelakisella massiliensis]|uniref:DUF1385 domain-containing protein n=1 Tax=Angelakisella massiliensis TaxID=1871018 RepID=UPI0008F85248|nr:DUF1385 domain-containing protein [Angelakisella massiliensis]